jgi:hypothetical protein
MKKYFTSIASVAILLAMLIMPVAAQAQTTSSLSSGQISAIISLLQAFGADQSVINNVETALGENVTPTTGSFCYTFNNNLGVGSSGGSMTQVNIQTTTDIQNLRTALIESNISGATALAVPNSMSGGITFNESYAAAVVQFQQKYGITPTGYVGPLTRGELNSLYGCSNQPVQPVNPTQQPSITSVSPTQGTGGTTITIIGQNFTPNSIVEFSQNGQVIATQTSGFQITSNQIVFSLSGILAANSTSGVYQLSVSNGGYQSNSINFTISSSSAVTLTQTQINAVSSLLESFSDNQTLINDALNVLNGAAPVNIKYPPNASGADAPLTTSQTNAVISLLQSFGASQSIISNMEIQLGLSNPTGGNGCPTGYAPNGGAAQNPNCVMVPNVQVSTDPNTPVTATVPCDNAAGACSASFSALTFDLTASNVYAYEPYLTGVTVHFSVSGSSGSGALQNQKVYLYQGSTQVGSAYVQNGIAQINLPPGTNLPSGVAVPFTVSVSFTTGVANMTSPISVSASVGASDISALTTMSGESVTTSGSAQGNTITIGSSVTSGSLLTQTQINAIMSQLQRFGANQNIINNTQTLLNGGATIVSQSNLTSSEISATISLMQSFGASQSLISNMQIVLGGSSTSSVPTITSITPTSGSAGTQITINGSGFNALGADSAINFSQNGQVVLQVLNGTSVQVSNNQIIFTLPAAQSALQPNIPVGVYQVTVTGNGAISNTVSFTVTQPSTSTRPSITSISPLTVAPGGVITINGSNFAPGMYVFLVNGSSQALVQVNANSASNSVSSNGTSISLTIPAYILPGPQVVTVTAVNNPNGPGPSNQFSGLTVTSGSITSGTLSVTTDPTSPAYNIVSAGSTGVVVGAYQFQATGEPITLSRVGLQLANTTPNLSSPADVEDVSLWNGSCELGTAIFAGTNTITALNIPSSAPSGCSSGFATIPVNGMLTLTVKADLNPIVNGGSVLSGQLLSINAHISTSNNNQNTQGVGVNSGTTYNASGFTNVAGDRIFQTVPQIALGTLPSSGITGDGKLIAFSITNPTNDPNLQLNQFSFSFATTPGIASISGVNLYDYVDSAYSLPASDAVSNGQLLANGTSVNTGTTLTAVVGNSNGFVTVPAGQTRYFLLKGTVTLTGSNTNNSITTTLLGDPVYPSLSTLRGSVSQLNGSYFVWSDGNTSTAATTAAQAWTNGYSLPGFPSSGLTESRMQ